MGDLPTVNTCPCCRADMIGGLRDNGDNAGAFFYFHPQNKCILQDVGVWPHNVEAWNTRAAPKVKPLVWKEDRYGDLYAVNAFGRYEIEFIKGEGWCVELRGVEVLCTELETLHDVKEFAQGDSKRRALSLIE